MITYQSRYQAAYEKALKEETPFYSCASCYFKNHEGHCKEKLLVGFRLKRVMPYNENGHLSQEEYVCGSYADRETKTEELIANRSW